MRGKLNINFNWRATMMKKLISTLLVFTMLFTSSTSVSAEIPRRIGDVTGTGGNVTMADALLILRHLVKLDTLTGDAFNAALITMQDKPTIADALQILRYLVKLPNVLEPDMSKMPTIDMDLSDETRETLLRFISLEMPGVDLSDFSFERGERDNIRRFDEGRWITIAIDIKVSYKGISLNNDKYSFYFYNQNSNSVKAVGYIWDEKLFEKTHELDFEPTISKDEVLSIAIEQSTGLPVTYPPPLTWDIRDIVITEYEPHKPRISDELMIYCLEERIVAYVITDSYQGLFNPGFERSVSFDIRTTVYVDIKTGEILRSDLWGKESYAH